MRTPFLLLALIAAVALPLPQNARPQQPEATFTIPQSLLLRATEVIE